MHVNRHPSHSDIIIVGGGLAGAALACALSSSQLKITLIERNPPACTSDEQQRIYAISPASATLLESIGVWPLLADSERCPVYHMEVFGDAGGAIEFKASDAGLPALNWIVGGQTLANELWENMRRQHNLTLITQAQANAIEISNEDAKLTLDNQQSLTAHLIVAADGSQSTIRRLAGVKTTQGAYSQHAVVANFNCSQEHHNTAWQWFRKDGIVACLPLNNRRFSLVWSATSDYAEQLCAAPARLTEHLANIVGNKLGSISLLNEPRSFPLQWLKVEHTVKPRLALIGDAAHAIHPLSGHGINLGFGDAAALAESLLAVPSWQDIGALVNLRPYARRRAEETLLIQQTTDSLQKLFSTRNPVLAQLRNHGMNIGNALGFIKQPLIRYASLGHF